MGIYHDTTSSVALLLIYLPVGTYPHPQENHRHHCPSPWKRSLELKIYATTSFFLLIEDDYNIF